MAAVAKALASPKTRPASWDVLMPDDGSGVLWQVWMRRKGPGYWLMRYATRLARLLGAPVTNPNALEDGGTFKTEGEARDLCRIAHGRTGGRYAVTYTPVLVGRAYPLTPVVAAGDRYFDPFKVFDFSATDAVREQARHVLVSVDELDELRAILTGTRETVRPRL